MGFGGGAFGTGSYTYTVIDDETIKLNQQKGVIYANTSALSPSTDNNTIYLNSNNKLAVKPSSITQTTNSPTNNITISSNTTLTGDVYCNNFTINSGVTLTTNGFNIFCSGTFINNGTINTGYYPNNPAWTQAINGYSLPNSYGGSGSGGGNSNLVGGSTLVAGGGYLTSGSTPTPPSSITNNLLLSWYLGGFQNYLAGAGGSGSGGGAGGNGIYIQANQIIAGTINASGQNNESSSSNGGAGGGGCIVLAYGSGGYTAGSYNVSPGVVQSSTIEGGKGNIITYNYSTPPINISSFNYTSTSGILNRNSSYQYTKANTTSTSPQVIISQTITPQYTGLIKVKAVVNVYNNTSGDGVFVGLYNGSNLIDGENLTSTTGYQQQIAYLYNEVLYTAPFSQQAFSIQFNAVGGGTAYAEIQEFTIEEVY